MKTKILKIQRSSRPIWETKLSSDGPLNSNTPLGDILIEEFNQGNAYSCEMIINLYDSEENEIPSNTILVEENQYSFIISKYGMNSLLKGVELVSLFDIKEDNKNDSESKFNREVEFIAYSIVARVERDTLFNNYNPNNIREYIEDKIKGLKVKFHIEAK